MQLEITDAASEAELDVIEAGLVAFNNDLIGPSNRSSLAVLIKDDNGQVVGGLSGSTARGWLYIDNIFVPPGLRGQGLATRLLAMAESAARERGCHAAWLDTINPDALRLYQRCGYSTFGTVDNFANGHAFSFMSKSL